MNDQIIDTATVQQIASLALQAVAIQWKAQGHNLTGNAIQQLETRIVTGADIVIQGYVVDYMANINAGVTAVNIPYSPGSGARSSKYIAGLIDYVKRRMGKSDREARSIAFAIASRHKREGMPSKASARFSSTGKRTGFIEVALEGVEPELGNLFSEVSRKVLTLFLKAILKHKLGGDGVKQRRFPQKA